MGTPKSHIIVANGSLVWLVWESKPNNSIQDRPIQAQTEQQIKHDTALTIQAVSISAGFKTELQWIN